MLAAFIRLIVVCVLDCAPALFQRSQALAATVFAGRFAVPLLYAAGNGSTAELFTWYLSHLRDRSSPRRSLRGRSVAAERIARFAAVA